jgi:hypothetical protein
MRRRTDNNCSPTAVDDGAIKTGESVLRMFSSFGRSSNALGEKPILQAIAECVNPIKNIPNEVALTLANIVASPLTNFKPLEKTLRLVSGSSLGFAGDQHGVLFDA